LQRPLVEEHKPQTVVLVAEVAGSRVLQVLELPDRAATADSVCQVSVEDPQAAGAAAAAAVLAELAQTETLATTIVRVTVVLVSLRHCSRLLLRSS
jgi:hypothetical protein